MKPLRRPPPCRHVAIEVWWGGDRLASTIAEAPITLDRALAHVTAVTVPAPTLTVDLDRDGEAVLRGPSAVRSAERDGWNVGGLRITLRVVDLDPAPPPPPLDRALLASVVLATLFAAVGSIALERNPPDAAALRASDRTRLEILRQLSRHGDRTPARDEPVPARPALPPRAAPIELPGTLPDPRESPPRRLPTTPFARMARLDPSPQLPTSPLWTPRLAAQAARFVTALHAMEREPAPPHADPDRDDHGGLGPVGTGAGAGCPHPEDCPTIAVHVELGNAWRPRAHAVATEAIRSRGSSGGALGRTPEPVVDTLAMSEVQRQIRRDALADVVRCYTQRAAEAELPGGRVVVRFTIRADGRVDAPAIVQTAVHDAPTEACIQHVLAAQVFPASRDAVAVVYPFVFSSLVPES